MPADYIIDLAKRLVVTTGVGCVTFEEIKSLHDRLIRDPSFDPDLSQLIDTTGVTSLDVSPSQALDLARGSAFSRDSMRAFIATKPALSGLGILLDIYRQKHSAVQVFYDRESAMTWLTLATKYRSGV